MIHLSTSNASDHKYYAILIINCSRFKFELIIVNLCVFLCKIFPLPLCVKFVCKSHYEQKKSKAECCCQLGGQGFELLWDCFLAPIKHF